MPESMEQLRVKALREYDVLDTDEEESFDNLAKMAAFILDTEFAQINFIDDKRQWSKARHNVDFREIPREAGFCNYTIRQKHEMIVNDTTRDSRFKDKDYVVNEPGIRFYAGVTIQSLNGFNIGTICVLGTRSKEVQPRQMKALRTLAEEVEGRLELMRSRRRIKEKNIYLRNSTNLMLKIGFDDFRVLDLNKEVERYFGYSRDEIIGETLDVFRLRQEYIDTLRAWADGPPDEKFSQVVKLPGRERDFYFQVDASYHNGSIYLTARDITRSEVNTIELRKNLRYQEVISDIALTFSADSTLDSKMNRALELLGTTAGVSRAYLFLDTDDGAYCTNEYEWCSEGVTPRINELQHVCYREDLPGWKEALQEHNQIISNDISDMTEGMQQYLEEQQIKSVIAFPIYRKSSYIGFIGFDQTQEARTWGESEINLIKTASAIISNAYKERLLLRKMETSERRLRRFIKQAPAAIALVDKEMNYMMRSNAWLEEFGDTEQNIEVAAEEYDNADRWLPPLREVLRGAEFTTDVVKVENEEGDEAWYVTKMLPWFDENDKIGGAILFTNNVTSQQKYQRVTEKSLREKETLLAEIHHRVKNNMAVISAFLQMEQMSIDDPNAHEVLQKNIGRIKVMAVIYEMLYKHHNFSRINVAEMVDNLGREMQGDFHNIPALSVDVDAVDIEITINTATPLALLFYEITSRFAKRIPEGVSDVAVDVSASLNDERIGITLCCSADLNGKELLAVDEPDDRMIMNVLAKQLKSELKHEQHAPGSHCWSFRFDKNYAKGSSSNLSETQERNLTDQDAGDIRK